MNQIPKIIHYCWVGPNPKPDSVLYCIESWRKYCPDYEIREWNESNYDFSKCSYMQEAYEAKKWGFVPDYARLDIVYQYGGIYLDTDVELVKNLDSLRSHKGFFGFEDTGEGDYYIACGLGFGAVPNNPLVRDLRDYYDGVHFRNQDGSLHLLPAPKHNKQVFERYGVVMNNQRQEIDGNVFFPAEYFCPKVFQTGKTVTTPNTYSIHHFTATWMDDQVRSSMEHNRKIYAVFGNQVGNRVLWAESVWEKYGLLGGVKKGMVEIHETLSADIPLLGTMVRAKIQNPKRERTGTLIFDTAMSSKNCGDQIIMEHCMKRLGRVMDVTDAVHISTHQVPQPDVPFNQKHKIVCGTNLLSCRMRSYGAWKLPKDLTECNNVRLMGVGFDSYNMKSDLYTRMLLRHLLSRQGYHSVRDSFSEQCLKKMGIQNVLNTGCPTMWGLTPEHCAAIPRNKATHVMCTITDYHPDEKNDQRMIEILQRNYKNVYLWLQGSGDLDYVKRLGVENSVTLVDSTLEAFDEIMALPDLDYVGTRLHAGIRALTFGHRSIIISIDNRARSIAKDTDLPVLEREEILPQLERRICGEFETKIKLPVENIAKWNQQFRECAG